MKFLMKLSTTCYIPLHPLILMMIFASIKLYLKLNFLLESNISGLNLAQNM